MRATRPIFLLSPANLNGKRGDLLVDRHSTSELATRLSTGGIPLGELFSSISTLYFRGKLAYAHHFAGPERTWVITAGRGLMTAASVIDRQEALRMRRVHIGARARTYRRALEADCRRLLETIDDPADAGPIVLLGSLRSDKYKSVLQPILGGRLQAPAGFARLGEMQRGARLLDCVRANRELDYHTLPA